MPCFLPESMEYMYLCSVAEGAKSPERPGMAEYVAMWLRGCACGHECGRAELFTGPNSNER